MPDPIDLPPITQEAGAISYAEEIETVATAHVDVNKDILGVVTVERYRPQPNSEPRPRPKAAYPVVEFWCDPDGGGWYATGTKRLDYVLHYRVIVWHRDPQQARETLSYLRDNIGRLFSMGWFNASSQFLSTSGSQCFIGDPDHGDVESTEDNNPTLVWSETDQTIQVTHLDHLSTTS